MSDELDKDKRSNFNNWVSQIDARSWDESTSKWATVYCRWLKRSIFVPVRRGPKKEPDHQIVRIRMAASGIPIEYCVWKSGGSEEFDQAAIKAIEHLAKKPNPLPPSLGSEAKIEIEIPSYAIWFYK